MSDLKDELRWLTCDFCETDAMEAMKEWAYDAATRNQNISANICSELFNYRDNLTIGTGPCGENKRKFGQFTARGRQPAHFELEDYQSLLVKGWNTVCVGSYDPSTRKHDINCRRLKKDLTTGDRNELNKLLNDIEDMNDLSAMSDKFNLGEAVLNKISGAEDKILRDIEKFFTPCSGAETKQLETRSWKRR